MARAVGIGGVFLKARDPKALADWYAENLGIPVSDDGGLVFRVNAERDDRAMTVFAHFPADTEYFGEPSQQVMLNFRVDDMDAVLERVGKSGVRVDLRREEHPYGRFAWFWDPEENRVELWEPKEPEVGEKT